MSKFRIVTDMVRKYGDDTNFFAGAELIGKLREQGYDQEILIYCGDVKKAEENCKAKNVSLNKVKITASTQELKKFCCFE